MKRTKASSPRAELAGQLIESLQAKFVRNLEEVSQKLGHGGKFQAVEWLRDDGRHGGGVRFVAPEGNIFNRASVNMSQIHYDDDPNKALASATALSTIVHPANPYAPSMHMHISWTELKSGKGYWRIMADLNPAIVDEATKKQFVQCLVDASGKIHRYAADQGDRYFYIPARKRHRGVAHFYLEEYHSDDPSADQDLSQRLGESVIDTYSKILQTMIEKHPSPDEKAFAEQLAYHTLYFFQVLTLDRGTSSGLLVHNQNDVGVLGSLPSHIDRQLLASWEKDLPAPQDQLLKSLLQVLPETSPCLIDEERKKALAEQLRRHFKAHPEALKLQASGDVIPLTVDNHS
ncbi:MAG: coproporphyrinogen III oxidase [Oligoflexus sp.]